MSELRQDRTSGRWVIIAPQRGNRPDALLPAAHCLAARLQTPQFDPDCPFCPGHENRLPGIVTLALLAAHRGHRYYLDHGCCPTRNKLRANAISDLASSKRRKNTSSACPLCPRTSLRDLIVPIERASGFLPPYGRRERAEFARLLRRTLDRLLSRRMTPLAIL